MKNVKLWLAIICLIILMSFYMAGILTLDNIKTNEAYLRVFIEDHYGLSVLLFFVACTLFINSPIPLAAPLKVLGGFFFGFYWGAFYNIGATLLACLVGFGISRYTFKDLFEKRYYDKLQTIENEIETNGFYYFLSLRLVMVVPYFLINILAGLSRISFRKYATSTLAGITPASFIYANGGDKLEQITSLQEIFRFDIILSLTVVAAISLFPVIVKKYRYKSS
ncbi:TVP38/TMEM64 family protein [Methylotuvimicrobium buryatense]|uniref:TVP38/TMEM64 family membrane protein n=1 Tax=Methylotuvimicrobium buryatense TaxID=95641 RepID=A0A4P9UKR5_METBY|nr:VTT domain-containing protein [Methylotuvimicrobium buryatense]QCW81080.1 TVP38/TMEM64 family protein [Methylotuvimicrobium buryatense]